MKRYSKARKIVFNEVKQALEILETPPEKYIKFSTILVLAKYFRFILGADTKKTRELLLEYCNRNPGFNYVIRRKTIDKALEISKLYPIKESPYKIPITRKEIRAIRNLPHTLYRIVLYMIFLIKIERFRAGSKKSKLKSMRPYLNYDIKTIYFNATGRSITNKQSYDILHRLTSMGLIEPTFKRTTLVNCVDFSNTKDVAFIVDATLPFMEQVIYFCSSCGTELDSMKRHSLCTLCYKKDRREKKTEAVRRWRKNTVVT